MREDKKYGASVYIVFVLIVILLMGIILEGGARIAFAYQDNIEAWLAIGLRDLDAYEIADSHHPGHYKLRRGFSQTLKGLIAAKEEGGHILGVQYIKDRAKVLNIAEDEILFQINSDGFKGPEIDRSHSRLRVLTIGDSCTFGTYFDWYSYPRSLERELQRMGRGVEVINGGVRGYKPKDILYRIEEFKALRPEITTIYIGWNALYAEVPFGVERYLYTVRLLKKAYKWFLVSRMGQQEAALRAYNKPKNPERGARGVRSLDRYTFSFMNDVEEIVREMQSAGSMVVVLTLPGLFVMDGEVTGRALEIGHLPTFTDNPYVIAKMSEEYNKGLRRLAQKYNLRVIDLDEWSRDALNPRDAYFSDSVHLYEEGQEMIGKYMARELLPLLPEGNKIGHR
ncbi:MAG: SGNH/GDSL hydrolase family protein [Thermodesulfobacteriota bacterium]